MNKFLTSFFSVVVACVTASSVHAQEIKGDAFAGEKINAMCVGCHGIVSYHRFSEVHRVPISGQAPSTLAALNAYKGERKHASMRGVAANLSDKDIADLAAYYSDNGPRRPEPELFPAVPRQELLTRGGCTSCSDNFSKPVDPSYPRLRVSMPTTCMWPSSYKTEGVPQIGRANAIMGGVAKQFSNAELKELANYLGSLPGELQTVQPGRFR